MVDKAVIYIHGKGGNAEEAIHYKPLFSNCDVIGLDYTAQFPWEAKEEFPLLFNSIYRNYKTVEVIANSIGAYFAINALSNQQIEKAYFISPVVDMERLIADMMIWANVTEDELKEKKKFRQPLERLFHGIIFAMQEKILLYGKSQRTFCMVKKIILPLMERYLNLYRGLIQHFLL